jgi:hypothetical protein
MVTASPDEARPITVLAFSPVVSRNFAFASSSAGAWPCVALDAGTMAVIDQNHRNSGGMLAELSC